MLDLCKKLLSILFLWPVPKSSAKSLLNFFFICFAEIVTLIGSYLYVVQIMDNIDEATEPGFVCFAYSTTIFIYLWLNLKKHKIEQSINQLESHVNESNLSFPKHLICINFLYVD